MQFGFTLEQKTKLKRKIYLGFGGLGKAFG